DQQSRSRDQHRVGRSGIAEPRGGSRRHVLLYEALQPDRATERDRAAEEFGSRLLATQPSRWATLDSKQLEQRLGAIFGGCDQAARFDRRNAQHLAQLVDDLLFFFVLLAVD